MSKGPTIRRRHSKAFDRMSDAQLDRYRELCLERTSRLEDVQAWATSEGIVLSLSAIHRDSQHFAVEAATDRLRQTAAAARSIGTAVSESGGIAEAQAATVQLYTQLVFDFLIRNPEFGVEDLTRVANLGKSLASLTGAEILRYRAEVDRRAREAAERATALAGETTGDMRERLTQLADSILSVGK